MRVHLKTDISVRLFSKLLLKIGNGLYPEQEWKVVIPVTLGKVVNSLNQLISIISWYL